jgi:hypothetical protein
MGVAGLGDGATQIMIQKQSNSLLSQDQDSSPADSPRARPQATIHTDGACKGNPGLGAGVSSCPVKATRVNSADSSPLSRIIKPNLQPSSRRSKPSRSRAQSSSILTASTLSGSLARASSVNPISSF